MFHFDRPSGWAENPDPAGGRIFEFKVGEGARTALATISILGGPAGGPAANINRWRGQVGLEPLDEEAAERLLRPVPLFGREASYVELAGKERAIVCAFALGRQFSMFVKLDGPPDVVDGHKGEFEEFLQTLKVNR